MSRLNYTELKPGDLLVWYTDENKTKGYLIIKIAVSNHVYVTVHPLWGTPTGSCCVWTYEHTSCLFKYDRVYRNGEQIL